MSFFEIVLIALGLSMDAFAVAVCLGLKSSNNSTKRVTIIALYFGFFQGAMPLIGYFVAILFADSIAAFDHWVAFSLLLILGTKMIIAALSPDEPLTSNSSNKDNTLASNSVNNDKSSAFYSSNNNESSGSDTLNKDKTVAFDTTNNDKPLTSNPSNNDKTLASNLGSKSDKTLGSGAGDNGEQSLSFSKMLPFAIATSIDAMAVGISFAFLKVEIFSAVATIALITFALSALGVKIGNIFGAKIKTKAELLGGIILILIGCKILIEHLFF